MDVDMVVVNVRMPKKTVKTIEKESAKLGYPNKSEYIREAVRRMISPELKQEVMEEVVRRAMEAKTEYVTHDEVAEKTYPAMKSIAGITKKIRSIIPHLREKYGVKRIGLFGSYARGEETVKSDLDLLVEFVSPVSLLEFLALERDLSKVSGRKVDLVMKSALKPRIGKQILSEVVYL